MGYFRGRLHAIRSHFHSAAEGQDAPVDEAKPPAGAPAYEDVARLAHSYWEARGCQDGSALEDWLRAEREINERK
jgi:hypothetical protein